MGWGLESKGKNRNEVPEYDIKFIRNFSFHTQPQLTKLLRFIGGAHEHEDY